MTNDLKTHGRVQIMGITWFTKFSMVNSLTWLVWFFFFFGVFSLDEFKDFRGGGIGAFSFFIRVILVSFRTFLKNKFSLVKSPEYGSLSNYARRRGPGTDWPEVHQKLDLKQFDTVSNLIMLNKFLTKVISWSLLI